jgi:restriction system protein
MGCSTAWTFSREASEFAARIDSKIVLIDGRSLARHRIDHDVGASTSRSYAVRRIDSDYFVAE